MSVQSPRWCHLAILETFRPPLMAKGYGGEMYVADPRGGPKTIRLCCDCGYEFEMKLSDFPGRRVMRSCGREECEFTPKPKASKPKREPAERGSVHSIYLHYSRAEQIREWALAHDLTFSRAVGQLAFEGLLSRITNE